MKLFKRDVSVSIGPRNGAALSFSTQGNTTNVVRDTNLKISFNVSKDTNVEENTCSVKIYNMTKESFNAINAAEDLQLLLKVGYVVNSDTIFFGDVRTINYYREGSNTVVSIDAFEGLYARRKGVLRKSYAPDTKIKTVIDDCKTVLKRLGISTDFIFPTNSKLKTKEIMLNKRLRNGYTAHHTAIDILSSIVSEYNYKVYINGSSLTVMPDDVPATTEAVKIAPSTGLIGTPMLAFDGTIKAVAKINPLVTVGSSIRLISSSIDDIFTIRSITYTGDNYKGNFDMSFEAV